MAHARCDRERGVRLTVLALQFAVTAAALAGLTFLIDWRDAAVALARVSPGAAVAAVALASASQVLGAWRLSLILGGCGVPVGFRRSVAFTWVGLFVGNVLPSTVGADVLYAVLLGRSGLPMGAGLFGLICNRAINVLVLLGFLAATPVLLPAVIDAGLPAWAERVPEWTLAGLPLVAVVAVVAAWRLYGAGMAAGRRLAGPLRLVAGLVRQPGIGLVAVAASAAMLMVGAWALLWLARDLVPGMGFAAMLGVLAVTLAAQIVPLSINGIGVQEAVFTICLVQACGWTAPDAVAFSLLARLLGIAISLPGLPSALRVLRRPVTPRTPAVPPMPRPPTAPPSEPPATEASGSSAAGAG